MPTKIPGWACSRAGRRRSCSELSQVHPQTPTTLHLCHPHAYSGAVPPDTCPREPGPPARIQGEIAPTFLSPDTTYEKVKCRSPHCRSGRPRPCQAQPYRPGERRPESRRPGNPPGTNRKKSGGKGSPSAQAAPTLGGSPKVPYFSLTIGGQAQPVASTSALGDPGPTSRSLPDALLEEDMSSHREGETDIAAGPST